MEAFSHMNRIDLLFGIDIKVRNGKPELEARLSAWPKAPAGTVLSASDYMSVRCWGKEYKSLMALFTGLLYMLDFTLAEEEFKKA
jgi:hypothetical protein